MARNTSQVENKARRGAPENKAATAVTPVAPATDAPHERAGTAYDPDAAAHELQGRASAPPSAPAPAATAPAAPTDYSHLKPRTAGFPKIPPTSQER